LGSLQFFEISQDLFVIFVGEFGGKREDIEESIQINAAADEERISEEFNERMAGISYSS
jgi:hypothetical protein